MILEKASIKSESKTREIEKSDGVNLTDLCMREENFEGLIKSDIQEKRNRLEELKKKCLKNKKELLYFSNSNELKESECFDKSMYKLIIESQEVNGTWQFSQMKSCMNLINSSYGQLFSKVKEFVENKSLSNVEDITITVIILLILNEKYDGYKDEHILIVNKTLKALTKLGIEYNEIIKI